LKPASCFSTLQSRDHRKRYVTIAALLLASLVQAQDERRIKSPDGQLEFRLFITTQSSNNLARIAYEVFYRDKPLVNTSFLGFDIQDQEPLLGENVGLTSSTIKNNSLIAKYMQNGSLGRLITVEARVDNNAVSFRYIIPQSTPLMEIQIAEEATEFRPADSKVTMTESKSETYPPMRIENNMVRLAHPYKGTTPLTTPWRIIK
jgi:Glycosyl-hydrolase 97 N-terminal